MQTHTSGLPHGGPVPGRWLPTRAAWPPLRPEGPAGTLSEGKGVEKGCIDRLLPLLRERLVGFFCFVFFFKQKA